jgi:glycosyltransferase involved in cell wall biosynthesis
MVAGHMSNPRLSVVIPTFNRALILAKCLDALCNQTCEHHLYELVVSDDGSSDETYAVVQKFMARRSPEIRYLRQHNAGANTARNRAIGIARGAILLLINDDIIATPAMIAEHLATHDKYPDDRVAVLGRVTAAPDLPPARLSQLHLDRAYEGLDHRKEHDWRAFLTCNVSMKKSLLDRGGLFEEGIRYHEDLELAERLSHIGLRVIYRPEALGYHDHLLTEAEFFSIAAREARALAFWSRKAPELWPVLGSLGFEPALPLSHRLTHRLLEVAINRATIPLLTSAARHCPSRFDTVSLAIYGQLYRCVLRTHLQRELRKAA